MHESECAAEASGLSSLFFSLCSVANVVIVPTYLPSSCFDVLKNTAQRGELSPLPLTLDPVNVAMVLPPSNLRVHVCVSV